MNELIGKSLTINVPEQVLNLIEEMDVNVPIKARLQQILPADLFKFLPENSSKLLILPCIISCMMETNDTFSEVVANSSLLQPKVSEMINKMAPKDLAETEMIRSLSSNQAIIQANPIFSTTIVFSSVLYQIFLQCHLIATVEKVASKKEIQRALNEAYLDPLFEAYQKAITIRGKENGFTDEEIEEILHEFNFHNAIYYQQNTLEAILSTLLSFAIEEETTFLTALDSFPADVMPKITMSHIKKLKESTKQDSLQIIVDTICDNLFYYED